MYKIKNIIKFIVTILKFIFGALLLLYAIYFAVKYENSLPVIPIRECSPFSFCDYRK